MILKAQLNKLMHATPHSLLGYRVIGTGPAHVLIIHDFFCDTTSYEAIIPYLDPERHTYCLADLRGYGKSMGMTGTYTIDEIAQDLITLTNYLGWKQFQAIGHSMGGQFIQYLALRHPERVQSLIAITPVPPCGSPVLPEVAENIKAAAKGNQAIAHGIMQWIIGERMGQGFIRFKLSSWYATSTEAARLGYFQTFSQTNFSQEVEGSTIPLLVIAGENDPSYSADSLKNRMLCHYPNSRVEIVPNASHYPIQESPTYLVGLIEKFSKTLQ